MVGVVQYTEKQLEGQQALLDHDRDDDGDEFTIEMPTGTGKSVQMGWALNEPLLKADRALVVFPRLALLSQFYRKYFCGIEHKTVLIICTDQKDVKDTADEDRDHLEGLAARRALKRMLGDVIVLTTYHSLELVLKNAPIGFDITLLDEAHHRSEDNVREVIDAHSDRMGFVVNLSATPSDDCNGGRFVYPFRRAVEDGAIRDYHVHYVYLDKKDLSKTMAQNAVELMRLTGNTRGMAFTAYSHAEKENRSNVRSVLKQWGALKGVRAHGITGATPPPERREILDALGSPTVDPNEVRIVVSCRTLGEGIDVPGVNAVVMIDPRSSRREIIQIIGRAVRLYRDENGHPLPDQPPSLILVPVVIDLEAYHALDSAEEKDDFLRKQAELPDGGSYATLLNVASALKEHDPEGLDICLQYPFSGCKTPDEVKRRREQVQQMGYRLVEIERDGNCFFRSLARSLGREDEHHEIRNEVVDALEALPQDQKLEWGLLDRLDEIRELRNDGVWSNDAMDVVPRVAAELFGLNLRVHHGETDPVFDFGTEDGVPINLQLIDGHYNVLEPVSSNEKKRVLPPPDGKRTVRNPRRRFHPKIGAEGIRVLWRLNPEAMAKGLARLEHKIEMEGKTFEDLAIEKAKKWIEFYRENNRWPSRYPKDNDDEKKMGEQIATYKKAYRGKGGATYESVNKMVEDVDKNFFDRVDLEQEMMEKANKWIAFYRENGRWPLSTAKDPNEKKMGEQIAKYKKAYRGDRRPTYESVNTMVRAVDPTFFNDLEQEMMEKAKKWIASYRENGRWPNRYAKDNDDEKKMGEQIATYKKAYRGKGGATYESVNKMVEDVDKNFFDRVDLEQEMIEKAKKWIAFYREDNKWPSSTAKDPNEKKMGEQIASYKKAYRGTGSGTGYGSVNTMVEDVDKNFFDRVDLEQEMMEKANKWIASYRENGRWPNRYAKDNDDEKKMGEQIAKYKKAYRGTGSGTGYGSVNTMIEEIDSTFFDRVDLEQEAIEKAKKWIEFYRDNGRWPIQSGATNTDEKKMGSQIAAYKKAYRGKGGATYESVNTMVRAVDKTFFNDFEQDAIEKAKKWIEFYRENNKWPSHHAKDTNEKKMGSQITTYKAAYRGTGSGTGYESVNKMVEAVDPNFFPYRQDKKKDSQPSPEAEPTSAPTPAPAPTSPKLPTTPPETAPKPTKRRFKPKSKPKPSPQPDTEDLQTKSYEELLDLCRKLREQSKKGIYRAPNPDAKRRINDLLADNLPKTGRIVVLDHEDFGTSSVLYQKNPSIVKRLVIPQRDPSVFETMRTHAVFGRCVVLSDLVDLDLGSSKIGMLYADLMGSLKEARPILEHFQKKMQKGAVIGVSISCRDGEEAEHTNQFASRLTNAVHEHFPGCRALTDNGQGPIVYGEGVRMATIVARLC